MNEFDRNLTLISNKILEEKCAAYLECIDVLIVKKWSARTNKDEKTEKLLDELINLIRDRHKDTYGKRQPLDC